MNFDRSSISADETRDDSRSCVPKGLIECDDGNPSDSSSLTTTDSEAENRGSDNFRAGPFSESNPDVAVLMNKYKLAFKDQQLETDYQVHRRHHITQYRLSYRLSFLFLCVVTGTTLIQTLFINKRPMSNIEVFLTSMPYVVSLMLYVSTHFDHLFVNYYDLLVGSFVLAICFSQFVADTFLRKDAAPTIAIYSVLIFIFLRIPFLYSVVYNVVNFFAFTIRYAFTVNLQKHIIIKGPTGVISVVSS